MKKTLPFPVENIADMLFSPALQWGNLILFPGTLPNLEGKNLKSPFVGDQFRQIIRKMEDSLKKCGLTFDDLLIVIILLKDMEDYDEINEIYSLIMKKNGGEVDLMPVRACFAVADLPFHAKVEVFYIAGKPGKLK